MKRFITLTFIYFLLSYGLFYYAYKFSSPVTQGLKDYTEYAKLYEHWEYAKIASPFNTRLVSSYCVHLMAKTGFYYETDIVHSKSPNEKVVFFNALLFNYICILLTTVLIFYFSWYNGIGEYLSFLGGLIYLFSFSTVFFYLNPLTEGLSALLAALIFISILKKNYWFVLVMGISLFQREYIFFLFGFFALLKSFFDKSHKKYYWSILAISIVYFLIYFTLRKTLWYTPHHNEQVQLESLVSNIFSINVSLWTYIKQSFLTQNLLVFYLAVIVYKLRGKLEIDKEKLIIISALFLQMVIISLVARLAQTIGRLFFLAGPLIVYAILFELKPIIKHKLSRE